MYRTTDDGKFITIEGDGAAGNRRRKMKSIRFYACYRIGPKQIAQVLVEMEPGKFSQRRETRTGVIYPTNKAAEADLARLNSQFAKS